MRDFDFDELDRAVSSAIGGQGGQAPASARDRVSEARSNTTDSGVATTPAASRAQSAVDEPRSERTADEGAGRRELAATERESAAVNERTVAQRSSTPRPQRGRFMDVVHPSTDMRQTTPLSEVKLAREVSEMPVEEVSQPPRQEVPMADIHVVARSEAMPNLAADPAASQDAVFDEPWEQPADSPFLPGAKVEKRPLGASQPTGFGDAATPTEEDRTDNRDIPLPSLGTFSFEETPSEPVAASEASTPVPALNKDSTDESSQGLTAPSAMATVGDLEAESVPEFDVVSELPIETHADLPAAPQSSVEEGSTPSVKASAAMKDSEAAASAPAPYAGPVAITPQYTPKPSSAQESGEIYDTESYHQPLAAPQKKKGGALKVALIILLIILLGAGAGAGIYFIALPMM